MYFYPIHNYSLKECFMRFLKQLGRALAVTAAAAIGAVCLSGCESDNGVGGGGGGTGGGTTGGGSSEIWLVSSTKEVTDYVTNSGGSKVTTNSTSINNYNWTRYTNAKNCEYQINGTSQSTNKSETATYTSTQVTSQQTTSSYSVNGKTTQVTNRTISTTNVTTKYVDPAISDVVTKTSYDNTIQITFTYDEESGLLLSQSIHSTGTYNGEPVNTTITNNINYSLVNSSADGTKTYKYITSDDGKSYMLYTVKNGITLKYQIYSNGNLITNASFSFPENSTIRSRLPSFTIADGSTCELVSSTSSEMLIRVKTYSDGVVYSTTETTYKKR
jgi:hypothetical protein